MMRTRSRLLWFVWLAPGERVVVRSNDLPDGGERTIKFVFRNGAHAVPDIEKALAEMLRSSGAESPQTHDEGASTITRLDSLGLGDTFCFVRAPTSIGPPAGRMKALLVYDSHGEIKCIGLPAPDHAHHFVIEPEGSRYVLTNSMEEIVEGSVESFFSGSAESDARLQEMAKVITRDYVVDQRSRKLVARADFRSTQSDSKAPLI
jgi:hypothetical protein